MAWTFSSMTPLLRRSRSGAASLVEVEQAEPLPAGDWWPELGDTLLGEREMWPLYGELGYFSLKAAWLSREGEGWLPSRWEDSEAAGLLYPELIFCREDERDGGLGRGDDCARPLALLPGRLKALLSDERKALLRAEAFPAAPAASAPARCRLPTARRWLWVSSRIFWASSWGSRGTVFSSWDLTVLSVSVLDWSDSPVSELLTLPTFWKGELGPGARQVFTGEVGVLTLPLEDTDTA